MIDILLESRIECDAFWTFFFILPNIMLLKGGLEAVFPDADAWTRLLSGRLRGCDYLKLS